MDPLKQKNSYNWHRTLVSNFLRLSRYQASMGLMPLKPGIENLILGKNFSFPENSFYKEKVFFLKE